MSVWNAGLIPIRLEEWRGKLPDLTANAAWTLAVMASFVADSQTVDFWASHATIAHRALQSVSTVQRSIALLEKLGLVERVGKAMKGVVRWRMSILTDDWDGRHLSVTVTDKSGSEPGRSERPTSRSVTVTDKWSVSLTDNPSESPEGLPKGDDNGRSDADALSRSAGATHSAHASSNEPDPLVAEVAERLSKTTAEAQRWIEQREAAATRPVKNRAAYIRRCLTAYLAEPAPRGVNAAPREGTARGRKSDPISEARRIILEAIDLHRDGLTLPAGWVRPSQEADLVALMTDWETTARAESDQERVDEGRAAITEAAWLDEVRSDVRDRDSLEWLADIAVEWHNRGRGRTDEYL